MRIVEPSVTLLWITTNPEQMIELAGRTCYKSEANITDESAGPFVRMLIERGHEAMIEHASASMRFVCDRGMTHELVRHRLASYGQESTRYCDYGKKGEIAVIQPPGIVGEPLLVWRDACLAAERAYMELIEYTKPQIARSVLPISLKTEIICTANLREWRHIFTLRTAPAAHPQIRALMQDALHILKKHAYSVFKDINHD